MNLLLLLRKADAMGVNGGLRLLILSLVCVLLLLMTYYFLVINRSLSPPSPAPATASSSPETERQIADAALMGKIKSAVAQTKRLHGYSIGVECKEGSVTLTGEVPTEIDKQLAADLAQEVAGVKEVNNQLRVVPDATPQPGENRPPDLSVNVEDLELQANLRERLQSASELKAQKIEIKVQNRQVTLTGQVMTEAQKTRAEELLRGYPKVAAIQNLLRLGANVPTEKTADAQPAAAPATSATTTKDGETLRQVKAVLTANRADFSAVDAIQIACRNGIVTLSGTVTTRAERALAERLTREIAGVKEIKSQLVVSTK